MLLTIVNIIFWILAILFGVAMFGGILISTAIKNYKYTFLFSLILTGFLGFLLHRDEIIGWVISFSSKLL